MAQGRRRGRGANLASRRSRRAVPAGGFGLGHLLHYGRELHATDQVIGVMLAIVLIGRAADAARFGPVERALHRRWGMAEVAR
jgi:ABC-type nitrate/sulfonate/bicarbonate transport system permease component